MRGVHRQLWIHGRVEVSGCCAGPRGSSCPHITGVGDSEPLHFLLTCVTSQVKQHWPRIPKESGAYGLNSNCYALRNGVFVSFVITFHTREIVIPIGVRPSHGFVAPCLGSSCGPPSHVVVSHPPPRMLAARSQLARRPLETPYSGSGDGCGE